MGKNNGRWIGLFIVIVLITSSACSVKLASWNLLNYSGASGAARHPFYQKVIKAMNPDILVVQEVGSRAEMYQFLNKVMNSASPGKFAAGPFVDGPDSDNAVFYDRTQFTFISNRQIKTPFRDISEYVMRYRTGEYGITFRIYSVNFQKGTTPADKAIRANEAAILRRQLNRLPGDSYYLVCGSFNIASSSEEAYIALTGNQSDNDGRLVDPANKPGVWHNNPAFARFHTHSTRMSSFGGGAAGGLCDRHDFVLVSRALYAGTWIRKFKAMYEASAGNAGQNAGPLPAEFPIAVNYPGFAGSFAGGKNALPIHQPIYLNSFGNDGLHFKSAINAPANAAVLPSIANSLYHASDRLPVIAEIKSGLVTD